MNDVATRGAEAAAAAFAFDLEQKILTAWTAANTKWWELAALLYQFHEGHCWVPLGHDSLNAFLAQPELGISRSLFFQMTRMWRDLVVIHEVDPAELAQLEPTRVREVTAAITRGDVSVEDALADCRAMGHRDIREKYRAGRTDGELAAEREPARTQCQECGSWLTTDEWAEWGEGRG